VISLKPGLKGGIFKHFGPQFFRTSIRAQIPPQNDLALCFGFRDNNIPLRLHCIRFAHAWLAEQNETGRIGDLLKREDMGVVFAWAEQEPVLKKQE
jgi:hypothetical protein